VVKSAQELLKEKIEKVRQEDEKERQLDPEKEYQSALLRRLQGDFKKNLITKKKFEKYR
jgi:hypothetical protein